MDFTACLLGLLWFGTRTRPAERGWVVSLRSGATLVQSGCTSVILVSPFAGVALVTSVSVHAQWIGESRPSRAQAPSRCAGALRCARASLQTIDPGS